VATVEQGEVPVQLVALGVVGHVAGGDGEGELLPAGRCRLPDVRVDRSHHGVDDLRGHQLLRAIGADRGHPLVLGPVGVGVAVEVRHARR
jgi:hypothetical protein